MIMNNVMLTAAEIRKEKTRRLKIIAAVHGKVIAEVIREQGRPAHCDCSRCMLQSPRFGV